MNLAVTGGHLTPALAFMQKARQENDHVTFFGRVKTSTTHQIASQEKSEVENLHAHFIPLTVPKFDRHRPLKSAMTFPISVVSVAKSYHLVRRLEIDAVVTFGGYVAFPVACAAKLVGIPVITHEQTHGAGVANQLIGKFATAVALSWEESRQFFPRHQKIVVTGIPVRAEFFHKKVPQPSWWPKTNLPVLYVTGGNQGSLIINETVAASLGKLTASYQVIHQCGNAQRNDYFTRLSRLRSTLPASQKSNYHVRSWFTGNEVAYILRHTYLAISRAGANTVAELIATSIPTIFVPLATHQNEQYQNANFAATHGAALILKQENLNPENLRAKMRQIEKDYTTYQQNLTQLKGRLNLDHTAACLYQLVKDHAQKTA